MVYRVKRESLGCWPRLSDCELSVADWVKLTGPFAADYFRALSLCFCSVWASGRIFVLVEWA